MTLLQSKRSQKIALWLIWLLAIIKVLAALFVGFVPAAHLELAVQIVAALGILSTGIAKLLPRNAQEKAAYLAFLSVGHHPNKPGKK